MEGGGRGMLKLHSYQVFFCFWCIFALQHLMYIHMYYILWYFSKKM